MNFKKILLATAVIATLALPTTASAWDLQELLNKAGNALGNQQENTGTTLTDIAGGLFTKTKLEVKDLAGTWIVNGAAVCFQSDNFLQKAGGTAAASIVENKLDPYYKKHGLTGSTLTIDKEGNFTLQMKKLKLTGTVTVQEDKKGGVSQGGNFYFNFNKFGASSLGSINTYVSKSLNNLDIMFDASKLRAILTSIASYSKMKMAQSALDMLNSYDGICIGFELSPYTASKK